MAVDQSLGGWGPCSRWIKFQLIGLQQWEFSCILLVDPGPLN